MYRAVATIFVTVALTGAARADDVTAALAHLDAGVAAVRAGHVALAHPELTAARDLAPAKPNPYRWLALTEVQLGDCPHALTDIDAFLARVRDDDPRVGEMTRLRELCRRGGVPAGQPGQPNLQLDHDITQPAPDPMFTQPREAPTDQPGITHRWWFWPTVGVTALAITGTTIYLVTRGGEATLAPVHCTATGCMP